MESKYWKFTCNSRSNFELKSDPSYGISDFFDRVHVEIKNNRIVNSKKYIIKVINGYWKVIVDKEILKEKKYDFKYGWIINNKREYDYDFESRKIDGYIELEKSIDFKLLNSYYGSHEYDNDIKWIICDKIDIIPKGYKTEDSKFLKRKENIELYYKALNFFNEESKIYCKSCNELIQFNYQKCECEKKCIYCCKIHKFEFQN